MAGYAKGGITALFHAVAGTSRRVFPPALLDEAARTNRTIVLRRLSMCSAGCAATRAHTTGCGSVPFFNGLAPMGIDELVTHKTAWFRPQPIKLT